MHRFLRAVGFSNISSKQDMDKLIGISMDKPSVSKQILSGDGRKMTELSHEFAHNTGLTIRGEYDKLGFFHVDHYFPYCSSSLITMRTDVTINKRVDTNAYTGNIQKNNAKETTEKQVVEQTEDVKTWTTRKTAADELSYLSKKTTIIVLYQQIIVRG